MKKNRPVSERRLLGIAGLGWLFDAMDVGILSFIIAALHVEWKLTPQEMSWIGSVNSIGMAVGAFVFGLLADRVGRKYVFMITLLFFSIGSGLSALTTTLWAFLVLRFFVGMGLGESFQSHLRSYPKRLRRSGGEESSSCSKVSGHSAGWPQRSFRILLFRPTAGRLLY